MGGCRVSRHAAERAEQRLGATAADRRVYELWYLSRRLPGRLAALLLGRRHPGLGREIRWAGDVLLVCDGQTVITLWRIDDEQLATLLVWRLTGIWTGRRS